MEFDFFRFEMFISCGLGIYVCLIGCDVVVEVGIRVVMLKLVWEVIGLF